MPLILLKKALKEAKVSYPFQILTDNEISKTNLIDYLEDNGFHLNCVTMSDHWSITVSDDKKKDAHVENSGTNVVSLKSPKIKKNHIVVINRDKMGHGSDELGEILIKGYVNALCQMELLPEKIIFYNSGVLICRKKNAEITNLKNLFDQGIDFVLCGACVDYFQIKEEIAVGRISNMLDICEILINSEKIIYL